MPDPGFGKQVNRGNGWNAIGLLFAFKKAVSWLKQFNRRLHLAENLTQAHQHFVGVGRKLFQYMEIQDEKSVY